MKVSIELFQWLNEQTDLETSKIDLVDGFVFMLKKVKFHKAIRLLNHNQFHSRFWRSHDRAFGYRLMKKNSYQAEIHLYQFYFDVALREGFFLIKDHCVSLTDKGEEYLQKKRVDQLDLLFGYIW